MGKIIGIDLGTTNSCVSVYEDGAYKIIQNSEGSRTTPSIVALTSEGETLVGDPAKRQAVTNAANTIYGAKRLIGRRHDEPAVAEMKENTPFKIVEGPNGDAWIEFGGEATAPSAISAHILTKMKETAEDYFGEEVTEAVVTVPAYFNDAQRQATKDAGTLAGLEIKRIINEPTAAALAYGYKEDEDKTIIVYDLGGGTFDVSVLEISEGMIEVKATNGDTFLGGENFDERIIDYIIDEFQKAEGIDLRQDKVALQRVKEAAEKAKIELSGRGTTEINIPFIAMNETGPKNLMINFTRAKLEEIVNDLVDRTLEPCAKALKDAGIDKSEIDGVLLVGGMTRMPKIQQIVEGYFGKKPDQSVNPDEVVAAGAAVQGGILSGAVNDMVLLDVTPLSLGIQTAGGVFTALIDRNTTIPTKVSEVFSTAADMQDNVEIQVGQGEEAKFDANKLLGSFELNDIPPAPKGVPQIEVTFDIDADGVLSVSAKDQNTGRESNITVKANGGLDEADIERMLKQAEANKDANEAFKMAAEARNQAESTIDTAEKALEEYGEQVGEEIVRNVTEAVASMREALDNGDDVAISNTFNALQEVSMSIGAALAVDAGAEAVNDDASMTDESVVETPKAETVKTPKP